MKTTVRLEQALSKLYSAFQTNSLYPECCMQCAVGTILDNTDSWKHLSDQHGSTRLNYVGLVHEQLGRKFNGYRPSELLKIESIFLDNCGYSVPLRKASTNPTEEINKNIVFQGLCKVVAYLCEIDKVPNVMSITKIFKDELDRDMVNA